MTSVSKYLYTDKWDDIVNNYNNTYHSTIKMKPVDVKSSTYIDSSKEINDKDPKFEIGDIFRISKLIYFFLQQGYTPNLSEEVFVIKKMLKILCYGHMLLMILMEKNCWNFLRKRIAKNK